MHAIANSYEDTMTLSAHRERPDKRTKDAETSSDHRAHDESNAPMRRLMMVRGCVDKTDKKVMSIRQFFEQIKSS
jgi:hypothetical protein